MNARNNRAQSFSRTQRLTRQSQFGYVMAKAERSADRYFTVLARSNSESTARLGLAISRKAARRAVDRNRIKRLAREAFRHTHPTRSVDIIVFARHAAAREDRRMLRDSLDRHFRRLTAAKVS